MKKLQVLLEYALKNSQWEEWKMIPCDLYIFHVRETKDLYYAQFYFSFIEPNHCEKIGLS